MRIASETGLFLRRKLMETVRQPVWLLSGLATPLLYILLFSPLLKNMSRPPMETSDVLNGFVPGILTVLSFGTGMGAGWTVIHELDTGVIERLRVSPASRFSILMGGVLCDALNFLVPSVLVILVCSFFGFSVHPAGLAVALALLSLLTAAISAWSASMGLILKQIGSVAAVVSGLQLPLTLLSGALLPVEGGPAWLVALARLNPMYYTVAASRVLADGTIISGEVLRAFGVVVPVCCAVIWWATGVYRKAVA